MSSPVTNRGPTGGKSLTGRPGPAAGNRGIAAIPLVLMLWACAEATEPDPSPAKDGGPYNMIDPVPAPAAIAPNSPTAGDWHRSEFEGRAAILFASGDKTPLFRMHCDGRGGIVLDLIRQEAVGDVGRMEIRSGDGVARLAVNEVDTGTPALRSSIPYNHDLLEHLRTPQGTLSVTAGDAAPLVLPLDASTAAFASACETPDQAPRGTRS